jgi:DNA-binding PadR family transcriptional regulator
MSIVDVYSYASIRKRSDPMAQRRKVNNLLGLAILAQLSTGRPMHPYEIATVLKQQGKEGDMNIKWGSLYTVVQNLDKHGLIEATTSNRDGRRPERTVYAITDAGRDELRDWLHELVAVPEPETNRFEAGLSVIGVLPPDEAVALLEARLSALDAANEAQRLTLKQLTQLPRVFLVESEYALAMRESEAAWVRSLLGEIAGGTLSGVDGWRAFHETGEMPADFARMLDEGVPPPPEIR